MLKRIILFLLFGLFAFSSVYAKQSLTLKPFRIAVVIGDQWQDSGSSILSADNATHDLHFLVVMLKAWGIPFDIIRLDTQFLNRYIFLDHDENPKYSTMIWLVNNSEKLWNPDYEIITEIVNDYGISLIALFDYIQNPVIQDILGIKYIGTWPSQKNIEMTEKHFVTRNLFNPLDKPERVLEDWEQKDRVQSEITKADVTVIAKQGSFPQITLRIFPSGSRVMWIGGDKREHLSLQQFRTLIRNSITWTVGYNLFKTWKNLAILRMDDPGSAENNWAENWHYSTLSEEMIWKYMINPLKEHDAILNIYIVPAFVNDHKKTLEPTWQQKHVDAFGQLQDYPSTRCGIEAGIKEGVFEIQSHGLTHMSPDLESPPKWWAAELEKEKSHGDWYREFYDSRRQMEIPEAEQRWRLKTSIDWIQAQFNVTPIAFTAGGSGISTNYPNNTYQIAGRVGFGWFSFHFTPAYLEPDFVIANWQFFGTMDSPLLLDCLPNGHDNGITKSPDDFTEIFNLYPQRKFIGMNEFVGYLHAKISGQLMTDNKRIELSVLFDNHYCKHFENHSSEWNFEIADWLSDSLGKQLNVSVDNCNVDDISDFNKPQILAIPCGTGLHTIEISQIK